jgi:peptidyl-prolyl cis-trans isomerase D
MLQKLNERIRGAVAWLVIGLIAITFTLFGVDYFLQSHQSTDVKAVVNDYVITNQDFETNYRRARSQRDPAQMTVAMDKRLKEDVLESMISNDVAVNGARNYGFEVNPEQANAAIVGIPQFQEDGHFSPERYQQALNGALFTPETFQKEVRQGMLLNQQRFAFMGSAFVLPYETERFVKLYMQTRDYDYLIIPSALFNKNIHITAEEIKRFYETHQSEFQSPEQVRIDYVQLSMPQVRSNIKISDADVQRYYDENKSNYLTPVQWQVAHILFAMPANATIEQKEAVKKKAQDAYTALQTNPEQFNHWVKTLSDDKISVTNNGVLPWIVAGQTQFDKALTDLTTVGKISAPLQTSNGYELFKLMDYKAALTKPLVEVQSTIKEQLQTELAQTEYAHLLEQLSDLSYQTPDSLTSVAETLKMPIQHSPFFSAKEGSDALTKNKAVARAAFNHDVLVLGNNSEPVQLDNESVVVLRINKHIPAAIKPLTEVQSIISEKLIKENAAVKTKEFGTAVLANKPETNDFLSLNKLAWLSEKNSSRDSDKVNPLINELGYSLIKPGDRKGRELANGDYALVQLKSINPGKLENLDKEHQASIAQQIEASYGMMDYDLYLNQLIKQAKIEKH